MSGNELVFNVFGIGIAAVVVWFVYVIFIKEKLLKAKGVAGKLAYVMKKDASSKYARCTFYAFHDYDNGYSQREWIEFCKQRTNNGTIDEKSEGFAEAVAPIINAIVVDENDLYVRRGLENLAHSGNFFVPGKTDELSLNYFVEPYEYVKNEVRKTSSTQPRTTVSHNSSSDRLTLDEKRELARAEQKYNYAIRMASRNPNRKIAEIEEKSAHAEYMRVLAKYAGKK